MTRSSVYFCSLMLGLAVAITGCSDDSKSPAATGGSGTPKGGSGGKTATGGSTGGSAGSTSGSAGSGGTTVGPGDASAGGAGSGGTTAGTGGTSAGGAKGGAGGGGASGSTAGAGGAATGGAGGTATGGSPAGGTGGGTGGGSAGASGTGGASAGASGTGGASAGASGTGGSSTGGSSGPLSEPSAFPANLEVPAWWNQPVPAPNLTPPSTPPSFDLCGFGAGTTGGGNATPQEVDSLSALTSAVAGTSPAVVVVTGKIALNGMIAVGSNKTIIGKGTSGHLDNGGLRLSASTNVIIRNLTISNWRNPSWDAISLEKASKKAWIDHNTFYTATLKDGTDGEADSLEKNAHDGAIDLKQGSQDVTVSWNRISDVWKMSLLGSSNTDRGTWNVTYHHNYYFRIGSRIPSIRGGTGHIFNNYFKEIFISGVNTRLSAQVLVEGNYFERVKNPIVSADSTAEPGFAVKRGNIFLPPECEAAITSPTLVVPGTGTLTSAPYTCTVDAADKVPALVAAFAGVGKIP